MQFDDENLFIFFQVELKKTLKFQDHPEVFSHIFTLLLMLKKQI